MRNEQSQPYSSCLTAHFELKSQRFSRLKLVFRCELRRKKHLNFPMRSRSGTPACNHCMSRLATRCCITAQHPATTAQHNPRNLGSPEETTRPTHRFLRVFVPSYSPNSKTLPTPFTSMTYIRTFTLARPLSDHFSNPLRPATCTAPRCGGPQLHKSLSTFHANYARKSCGLHERLRLTFAPSRGTSGETGRNGPTIRHGNRHPERRLHPSRQSGQPAPT